MSFIDVFDFVRVAGAMVLVLIGLPVAARRWGGAGRNSRHLDAATGFVSASLFFQVAATVLGNWRLCYGGMVFVASAVWLGAMIAFASRRRWIWDSTAWRGGTLRALQFFEREAWRRITTGFGTANRTVKVTGATVALGVLCVLVVMDRAGFALANCRFLGAQSYERALSLQALIRGGAWNQDGSVALLAAVSHFSGADGATVIRFAGPLFAVLLVMAAGYCAWTYVRTVTAAFLGMGLMAIYPATLGFDSPGEVAGPEMAVLYWILAVAMLRPSRTHAGAAAAVAFLIHGQFTPVMAGTILCVSTAIVFAAAFEYLPRSVRVPAGVAALGGVALLLAGPAATAAPDGPYQYESAARAVAAIAREFPRNKWMIVAPAQELAATYGRGWHVQLSEFVRKYKPADVARPEFHFNYTADDLFVFVEKEPLHQAARSAAMAADEYSYQYFTQAGRTALEFQAAQIMTAYTSTHRDASTYAEDDKLIVFRITLSKVPKTK